MADQVHFGELVHLLRNSAASLRRPLDDWRPLRSQLGSLGIAAFAHHLLEVVELFYCGALSLRVESGRARDYRIPPLTVE